MLAWRVDDTGARKGKSGNRESGGRVGIKAIVGRHTERTTARHGVEKKEVRKEWKEKKKKTRASDTQ